MPARHEHIFSHSFPTAQSPSTAAHDSCHLVIVASEGSCLTLAAYLTCMLLCRHARLLSPEHRRSLVVLENLLAEIMEGAPIAGPLARATEAAFADKTHSLHRWDTA
jgi:hypothetical protein